MADVTQLLSAMEAGDPRAAGQLLPLVYDELRRLAAQRLAQESAGQTLEPTALVHEAYLRLVGSDVDQVWDSRGHFFAAAAVCMRRTLVDNARRKRRLKRGGEFVRVDLADHPARSPDDGLLALDDALVRFAVEDPAAARVVELRHFGGYFGLESRAWSRWVRAGGSRPSWRPAPVPACRYTPGSSSLSHLER